jgi:DNA-directed RNA polymerase specialized sigma54-like protein
MNKLKVKTRQEMADELGMHRTTLNRKLKDACIYLPNGLISPKDQKVIYEHFGYNQPIQNLR